MGTMWEAMQDAHIRMLGLWGDAPQRGIGPDGTRTIPDLGSERLTEAALRSAVVDRRQTLEPATLVDLVLALFELGERVVNEHVQVFDESHRGLLGQQIWDVEIRLTQLWDELWGADAPDQLS
jgi:hypothetical protein